MMYPVIALIGIMLLTWGAAVWASFEDKTPEQEQTPDKQTLRKVA